MASLKDIADKLNISITTVSWTLSGQGDKKGIAYSTQEKVRHCAKEMNYRPNLLARSLISGKSNTLGLIIPDLTDSFYSTIARQIENEAEQKGYSLMIASSESDPKREDRMLTLLQSKQVDGIIIAPTKLSKKVLSNLINEGMPLVTFDRLFTNLEVDSIVIDNRQASYNVVRQMIARGAKKIAILITNPHLFTMNERRMGYEKALIEAGIPINENLIGNIPFCTYVQDTVRALDYMFKQEPEIDGFFFTTHILAFEAFCYFSMRDINIKHLLLGSIHGVPSFWAMSPNIIMARIPVEKIGIHAVRMVTEQIERKATNNTVPPQKIVLNCTYPKTYEMFRNSSQLEDTSDIS